MDNYYLLILLGGLQIAQSSPEWGNNKFSCFAAKGNPKLKLSRVKGNYRKSQFISEFHTIHQEF